MKKKKITLRLLFESIKRSATSESNFSCDTSDTSGLRFRLFFNDRMLPMTQMATFDHQNAGNL